jgi:DNA-binding response OmpR family regulator
VNIFKVAMRKDKAEGTAVLIISYDYVLRDILTRILSAKGYRVVNRSVGFHGIRTFQKSKGKFDIVVIDSELPDMSGLGVAKKIKEANRTTPTILLRGWEKGAEEKDLRDLGVDITIHKPLFMDKTYELIENAVASAEKFNAK